MSRAKLVHNVEMSSKNWSLNRFLRSLSNPPGTIANETAILFTITSKKNLKNKKLYKFEIQKLNNNNFQLNEV